MTKPTITKEEIQRGLDRLLNELDGFMAWAIEYGFTIHHDTPGKYRVGGNMSERDKFIQFFTSMGIPFSVEDDWHAAEDDEENGRGMGYGDLHYDVPILYSSYIIVSEATFVFGKDGEYLGVLGFDMCVWQPRLDSNQAVHWHGEPYPKNNNDPSTEI